MKQNKWLNWIFIYIFRIQKFFAGEGTFVITDVNLYVPVGAWSTHDNAELLRKSGFKRTINWNKYLSKINRKIKSIFRLPSWS